MNNDIFHPDMTFADLRLRSSVLKGIEAEGFSQPTDIQAQLIPAILKKRDVVGQARTGTGKTAAFSLPILHMAEKDIPQQALILVPTRELAIQVVGEFNRLGKETPVKAVGIYGGEGMDRQIRALEKGTQVVVGTPGRVMDLHQRGKLPYNRIKFAVLDEVDRMLDIGFRDDIRRILGSIKHRPQTIFVSATLSPEIEQLADRYLKDPIKIATTSGSLTVSQVEQSYFNVEPWDKQALLIHLLKHEEPALTLVFCRTKVTVDRLSSTLKKKGVDAYAIHGDMPQRKRNSMMSRFRAGSLGVLVASDLAARGLDVAGITHVINYDLPEDPEVYIHRIGRTARVGQQGTAWSFVTPDQGKLLTEIEKLANVEIPHKEYPDFTPGPVPQDISKERKKDEQRLEKARKSSRYTPPNAWDATNKPNEHLFPGGITPTKPPQRTLGGKIPRRRKK